VTPLQKAVFDTIIKNRSAPSFKINPDQVQIMLNPNMYGCAFYDMMTKPKERLGLTTMFYHYKYVHEQNNYIHKNLLENQNLKMRYVCDFTRE